MGLSKKQLTGSDIFQRTLMQFGDWCQRNLTRIAVVVVPTVLLVIIVLGMQMYMGKQKSRRMDKLAGIDALLQQEQIKQSTQLADLQTRIATLTKSDKGTDKKSAETLRKQLEDLETAQDKKAYSLYHDFFQAHQQDAEGWAAGMNAVGLAIQAKRYDDAKAILAKILLHSTDQQFHQTQKCFLVVLINKPCVLKNTSFFHVYFCKQTVCFMKHKNVS